MENQVTVQIKVAINEAPLQVTVDYENCLSIINLVSDADMEELEGVGVDNLVDKLADVMSANLHYGLRDVAKEARKSAEESAEKADGYSTAALEIESIAQRVHV